LSNSTSHAPGVAVAADRGQSNGIEARRARQRLEARRTILDATRELLTRSDEGDFSIRALANECGYSPPTIYNHFGDKRGLLAGVLDDGLRSLAAELDAEAPLGNPLARLRFVLLTFVRYTSRHPAFSRLWETTGRQHPPPSVAGVRAHLDEPLTELLEAGRFGAIDRSHVGQMLWAMLHGLVAVQRAEPNHPWAPELAELAVDTLLRGLTAAPDSGEVR